MKLSSENIKTLFLARTKWVRHCWLCVSSEKVKLIDIIWLHTKHLGMTYFGAVLVVEQVMLVKVNAFI